jgi:hypothetical protein
MTGTLPARVEDADHDEEPEAVHTSPEAGRFT